MQFLSTNQRLRDWSATTYGLSTPISSHELAGIQPATALFTVSIDSEQLLLIGSVFLATSVCKFHTSWMLATILSVLPRLIRSIG